MCEPIILTLIYAAGAIGTLLAGLLPAVTVGRTRATEVHDMPLHVETMTMWRYPRLRVAGWASLMLSFLGQIAWVWFSWATKA